MFLSLHLLFWFWYPLPCLCCASYMYTSIWTSSVLHSTNFRMHLKTWNVTEKRCGNGQLKPWWTAAYECNSWKEVIPFSENDCLCITCFMGRNPSLLLWPKETFYLKPTNGGVAGKDASRIPVSPWHAQGVHSFSREIKKKRIKKNYNNLTRILSFHSQKTKIWVQYVYQVPIPGTSQIVHRRWIPIMDVPVPSIFHITYHY